MSGTYIGTNGYEHSDVTGERGKNGANREAAGSVPIENKTENEEKHDTDNTDGPVLPVHVRACAFLNGLLYFLHTVVAGRLLENPLRRNESECDGERTRAYG